MREDTNNKTGCAKGRGTDTEEAWA